MAQASTPLADHPAATVAKPDFKKVVAFSEWSTRWQSAAAEEKPALKAEGLQLAQVRRPEFKKLIATDPQRALEQAVRPVVRQTLPEEIVQELEQPVSARGDYKVYFGRPQDGVEVAGTNLTLR